MPTKFVTNPRRPAAKRNPRAASVMPTTSINVSVREWYGGDYDDPPTHTYKTTWAKFEQTVDEFAPDRIRLQHLENRNAPVVSAKYWGDEHERALSDMKALLKPSPKKVTLLLTNADDDMREYGVSLARRQPKATPRVASMRRNPDAATPRAFLMVLRSKLTQHDARLSAKQPNLYRLGHYLAAAERVEKDMGRSLDSDTPAALEKLRRSLHERFTMPFAPASAVERQIDAYLASGTMPSLVRKNPPKGFLIAGPAVKTMSERLRISKADAQRLKDMMDTGAPRILQTADKMMGGNGVERISGVGGGLMYVNMGDTYDTTLIYDYKTNRFVVSSWGDIVERQPRRFGD